MYVNIYNVNSKTISLSSLKSVCLNPWKCNNCSKEVINISLLLSSVLFLTVLNVPVFPLSPIWHPYDQMIHWNVAMTMTCWWRWECKNRKPQTLQGALANVVLGHDVKAKHLVIFNDLLLKGNFVKRNKNALKCKLILKNEILNFWRVKF